MMSRGWVPLCISATLGYLAGAWIQPSWQDVIEPAQVLAGLVQYPADNPVYLYSTATWTVLHQLVAVALRLGLGEHSLAIVISGLAGALSFSALSFVVKVAGGSPLLVALGPLVLHASNATRFSPGYPVLLLGWPFTYGIVGHGAALFTLALMGLGRHRAAAFCLGLLPAIHPGIGALMWAVIGVTTWIHRTHTRLLIRDALPALLTGLAITSTSAIVHFGWFAPPDTANATVSTEMLATVRRYWDEHRQPLEYTDLSVLAALVCPWLIWWWQRNAVDQADSQAPRLFTTSLIVAAGVAVSADLIARFAPPAVAAVISRPMPTRLLALPLMAIAAWMLGATTAPQSPARVRAVAYVMFGALAVFFVPPIGAGGSPVEWLSEWASPVVSTRLAVAQFVVASLVALAVVHRLLGDGAGWWSGRPLTIGRRFCTCALTVLTCMYIAAAVTERHDTRALIADRTNNIVLAEAARTDGLLIIGAGQHLLQAATRRPLLIDPGALDALVYVPAAIGISDQILRSVYGVTLHAPGNPVGAAQGALSHDVADVAWTSRPVSEWQQLRERYGVTQVLSAPTLTLQLPRVAGDAAYTLWEIPAR